jgi:pyruvate dehydrogenase E2 component (dihydrolipoamide acetyltransferase)
MEVPAVVAGTLAEVRAQVGQTVLVGAVVAVLVEPEGDFVSGKATAGAPAAHTAVERAVPSRAANAVVPTPARVVGARPVDPFQGVRTPDRHFGKATLPDGGKVTPLARRLAAEAGIDLGQVAGSGPHGRIVAADVRGAPIGVAGGAARATSATGRSAAEVKASFTTSTYRELSIDNMRKIIARRLSESKQSVPHFYVSVDVDVDALLTLRKQINENAAVRVTVNDLLVKAYAMALQQVPAANVVWAEECLLQFERSDVGVAVSVPGGLVTPVVRDADLKSLQAISAEIADLAARGRARRLQPHEYAGGAATVSNLGMHGVRSFQAILNPPQSTILAIGAAIRVPVEAQDGTVRFGSRITTTLSVDHRAVDGAVAGELLAALRKIVENPISILL